MSKYLPHCFECGTSKAILTPISAALNRKYLCLDCNNCFAPLAQLDRAADYGSAGSGFKFSAVHQELSLVENYKSFFLVSNLLCG